MIIDSMRARTALPTEPLHSDTGFSLPAPQAEATPAASEGVELAGIRGLLRRALEAIPRNQDTSAAMQVLEARGLDESFLSDVQRQLETTGRIRIGVIDDFDPDGTGHGENVVRRLLASAPDHLRPYIDVIQFDTSRGNRAAAMEAAVEDGKNEGLVALSISGGFRPINVDNLRTELGADGLDSPRAFWVANQRSRDNPDYDEQTLELQRLSLLGQRIPVITPVLNDGNTSLEALAPGTIVTSIEARPGTRRTEAPDLVEHEVTPIPGGHHTSQSAPLFIGALLENISKSDVEAWRKR